MRRRSAADEDMDVYLRTAEVARMLHVSPKTITRWASEGKLPSVRTLGGHRRFSRRQIVELTERLAREGLEAVGGESPR
jgi:excisionase family DNA binding protein